MKRCPSCQSSLPGDYTHCPRDGSTLVAVAEWIEGSLIRGKYRILAKVGEGGMAAVYKALHTRFNEIRALKVISPELASDVTFVRRFEQEAIVTRKLQHPNAVRVDDIDEAEDGRPFIVMEFVEGRSLKQVIEEEAPMLLQRVSAIVQQSAAALDAAHTVGLIHRDIKPGNIALARTTDPSGNRVEQVKVLDFGIAKLREARLDSKTRSAHLTLTDTGMMIGTPAYMSPEQAKGMKGDQLDGRSDIYSLGVVMYQMLTGDLPLKADSTLEQLMAHLNTPPRPIHEVRPDLPPEFAAAVMRCLEKNRDLRPATGAALIKELQWASSRPAPAHAVTAPSQEPPSNKVAPEPETTASLTLAERPEISDATTQDVVPKPRPIDIPQSRRLLWGSIACLLILGLASLAYFLRSQSGLPKVPVVPTGAPVAEKQSSGAKQAASSASPPLLPGEELPSRPVPVPAQPATKLTAPNVRANPQTGSAPATQTTPATPAVQSPDAGRTGPAANREQAQPAGLHSVARVRVAPNVEADQLLHKVAPAYPPLAQQARVQGVVTLKAQIGSDGSIENLELVSGHPLLAPAAIDAAKQWKYKPYLLNGQPVPVETEIQVDFKLAVDQQPAVAVPPATPNGMGQIYHVGAGVSAPSIVSARQPDYTDEANRARKEGKVVLSLVVDTTGHAQNLRVVTPLGYGLDEKAIEAVKQWRFQPGMKDGKPVNVQINVEVEFHEY